LLAEQTDEDYFVYHLSVLFNEPSLLELIHISVGPHCWPRLFVQICVWRVVGAYKLIFVVCISSGWPGLVVSWWTV